MATKPPNQFSHRRLLLLAALALMVGTVAGVGLLRTSLWGSRTHVAIESSKAIDPIETGAIAEPDPIARAIALYDR